MRAIVIKHPGGPEVLQIATRPDPDPALGYVLIEVKALGVNQAEAYFRRCVWGVVGFLGGGGPLEFDQVFQLPGGRLFSAFAMASVLQ